MTISSLIPPARPTRRNVKLLVFSDWGGGKSSFACTLPGPRAIFDLEHGCDFYKVDHTGECPLGAAVVAPDAECNGCGGDYHLTSLNPEKIMAGVRAVVDDQGKTIRSVIIDPVTVFQKQMVEAFGKEEMQVQDWKPVKGPLQRMLFHLMNAPVHFCLTARLKDLEVKKVAGKTEVKTVDKPDMWKDFGYAPDTIMRLRMEEPSKNQFKWTATILKNRVKGLKPGMLFESGFNGEDPLTFDKIFGPALAKLDGEQTIYEDPLDAAEEAKGEAPTVQTFNTEQNIEEVKRAMEGAAKLGSMNDLKTAFTRFEKLRGQCDAALIAEIVRLKDLYKEQIATRKKS